MRIARITVGLEDVEPAVARTLEVPEEIRLDHLHLTIQAAMGWDDSHLYEFAVGRTRWTEPDPDFADDIQPANKATLADLVVAAGKRPMRYVYDFGDDWRHRLEVLSVAEAEPGHLYPRLLEATGACPPEDIGGPPGYGAFLEAVGDPGHPDHEEFAEWAGDSFDPKLAPADELRLAVLKLAKRWKPKRA